MISGCFASRLPIIHKRLRAFENLSAMVWIALCMIFTASVRKELKKPLCRAKEVRLAYPMGFEPMTYRVGVCHSIQLGYGYTLDTVHCSTLEQNEQYPKTNISSWSRWRWVTLFLFQTDKSHLNQITSRILCLFFVKTSESAVQSVKTCYQAFGNRFQHQLHLKSAFRRAGFEYLPMQSQLFCHASV